MKIRIKGNALRIRVQRKELLKLSKVGKLEERTTFGPSPDQCLTYSLHSTTDVDSLQASFAANRITVLMHADIIAELISTDRVGVEKEQRIGEKEFLSLLVEKDFKCLTPREEDADAFDHPDERPHPAC